MHCVSFSASIDIYIGVREIKKIHYLINKVVPLVLLIVFENVLPAMVKRIKFNCSFMLYLLLSIQHNI